MKNNFKRNEILKTESKYQVGDIIDTCLFGLKKVVGFHQINHDNINLPYIDEDGIKYLFDDDGNVTELCE